MAKVELEMNGYTIKKDVYPNNPFMDDDELIKQAYREEYLDNATGRPNELIRGKIIVDE